MSKEKFTKGPWRAAGKEPSRIYGWVREDKESIITSTKGALGETEPNAYLIAAAPEMYEIIKSIVEEAKDCERRTGNAVSWASDAESVLAKARGKLGPQ